MVAVVVVVVMAAAAAAAAAATTVCASFLTSGAGRGRYRGERGTRSGSGGR